MDNIILETFAEALVKETIEQGKDILRGFKDETCQLLNKGFKEYVAKQQTKYAFIKTLLRGSTPVYLYEIYYHLNISNGKNEIKTDNIENIFHCSNYITIIGDAGSGKSTLIKHLFLNSIENRFAIPILIELRYLNEDKHSSFEDYIISKIFENNLSENAVILERLLLKGKFIFFLDGYDELESNKRNSIIEQVNSFINKFDKNKFILTTRPYTNIENLPLFHNYQINNLNKEKGEIDEFIELQLKNEKEISEKIKSSIKTNTSSYIESFLTNPLLLTLYILTYQSNATVPDKKYIFYRRVINALFSEHDSKTKLGFVREKKSGLTQEQFETALKAFSYVSFFKSKFNWDGDYISDEFSNIKKRYNIEFENNKILYDLKLSIALWLEDNGIYSFAHRSLQEYFAALFIKNLSDAEKSRLYHKIVDRFEQIKALNEIENFLSLCDEMDTYSFQKYYYLPLLNELINEIQKKDKRDSLKAFILFFTDEIIIEKQTRKRLKRRKQGEDEVIETVIDRNLHKIRETVYRSIYIHIQYTRHLHMLLTHHTTYQKLVAAGLITENEIESSSKVKIPLTDKILDYLVESFGDEGIKLISSFLNFLLEEREKNSILISQTDENNKLFVDLI